VLGAQLSPWQTTSLSADGTSASSSSAPRAEGPMHRIPPGFIDAAFIGSPAGVGEPVLGRPGERAGEDGKSLMHGAQALTDGPYRKNRSGPTPTSKVSPPSPFSHTTRTGRPAAIAATRAGTVTSDRGGPAITCRSCHAAPREPRPAHAAGRPRRARTTPPHRAARPNATSQAPPDTWRRSRPSRTEVRSPRQPALGALRACDACE
jgi:hypothetical protein